MDPGAKRKRCIQHSMNIAAHREDIERKEKYLQFLSATHSAFNINSSESRDKSETAAMIGNNTNYSRAV